MSAEIVHDVVHGLVHIIEDDFNHLTLALCL